MHTGTCFPRRTGPTGEASIPSATAGNLVWRFDFYLKRRRAFSRTPPRKKRVDFGRSLE